MMSYIIPICHTYGEIYILNIIVYVYYNYYHSLMVANLSSSFVALLISSYYSLYHKEKWSSNAEHDLQIIVCNDDGDDRDEGYINMMTEYLFIVCLS
jgi:hypothetical protein